MLFQSGTFSETSLSMLSKAYGLDKFNVKMLLGIKSCLSLFQIAWSLFSKIFEVIKKISDEIMMMVMRYFVRASVCPQSVLWRGIADKVSSIKVRFKNRGETLEATGKIGQSLYDIVVNADLPIDGFGACEGTLACCTCHVILHPKHYERLPSPTEDELDLLDLAPEATDFSRLGCQVKLTENDQPSVEVVVPSEVRDARAYD